MMKTLIDKEIIRDIAHGMADSELTQKYNLSEDQLQSLFKQLATARAKRIQNLSGDFRSGMSRRELMKKYQLTSEALGNCLRRLVKINAIASAELYACSSDNNESNNCGFSRSSLRNHPIPMVTVCEIGKPRSRYLLRDIAENGIGVSGIIARVDETKVLAVVGDEFGEIAPFEFEAQCRWARQLETNGAICSGFRIMKISEQDAFHLRELVQGFTFAFDEY